MNMLLDLDTLTLTSGSHERPEDGACLLEAVSWMAGEPWSDTPVCVDRTLAAFGRSWNDGMRTDAERAQLVRYVPALIGTAGSEADAVRRAWLALDWLVRVSAPAWLDLAGLSDAAESLRGLSEQTGPDAEALGLIRSARLEASAARGAAWDAAGAAARGAAGDAAWGAAWATAWAAARAAAWAAAGAAAGDAAGDDLNPTVTELQASAHDLFRSMILAGPHNPAAVAEVLR